MATDGKVLSQLGFNSKVLPGSLTEKWLGGVGFPQKNPNIKVDI
jgi:hypothetical protein